MPEEPAFDETHQLYHRFLGMDAKGRKPHFWLGSDKQPAIERVERLEELWRRVKTEWRNQMAPTASVPLIEYLNWAETEWQQKSARPTWDEITLAVAKTIAKGGMTFPLPRMAGWSPAVYTLKIMEMQRRFPVIQFVPVAEESNAHQAGAESVRESARAKIDEAHDDLALVAGYVGGQSFCQVIDAYIAHLEKLPDASGWYGTQIKQCGKLKQHHADLPLSQLGLSKVEEMLNFWRHRPIINGKRAAYTTCRNQVVQLVMLWKWLDRNEQFKWQTPRGFHDLKQAVKRSDEDEKVVEVFTVAEIKILWQHATPLVRLEMLLALNAGFKYAEIASLRLSEISLNTAYPGIVRTDRPAGLGSWICRRRRKTQVYGEWSLWPWTVAGIEWAKTNRKKAIHSPTDFLLVTRSGRTLDAQTSGKNKSDKIYSSWRNLYRTIAKAGVKVRYLPFKNLEKTSTDWIRPKFGWEIANLFTSHGKPVKSDTQLEAYSNKPFVKLFEALNALADYLRPAFEGVEEPWKERSHNSTTPQVVARIKELRKQGKKLTEIAEAVGLHWVTVGKILRKLKAA